MPLPNFSRLSLRACQPTGRPVLREGGGPNPAGLDGEEGAICNICLNPLSEMANNSDAADPEDKAREDAVWAALGWNNTCQQLETCGHQFHTQCIAEVAQSTAACRDKCPTCRLPLDEFEFNWLQSVTVPPRPGSAPGLPTQPNWREICQRLHGESTRREPPGPMRDLNDADYEAAKRFVERKLRDNVWRQPEEILALMLDVEQLDGPGFGRINSGSAERLRELITTTREDLLREREAVILSFLDDGTIATLLLMQPKRYFEGMSAMPGGERPPRELPNKRIRLGERVGNMLAALYPREFEPWWEPRSDNGMRIGRRPDFLRERLADAAESAYGRLAAEGLSGPIRRTEGESVQRRTLRLLPDLRRLWANGAAHESEPHIGSGDRRRDGYKVLEDHRQLRDEVLNLYHLTRGEDIHALYARQDNSIMSIDHREAASDEFFNALSNLAALVVQTAVAVPSMTMTDMSNRENELLLPDLDSSVQLPFADRPIDAAAIRLLLSQTISAEQVDERTYRRLGTGAKERELIAAAAPPAPARRARWRGAAALVRQRSLASEQTGQPDAQRPRTDGPDAPAPDSSPGPSPSPYARASLGSDEETTYGQFVFARLLHQELLALDPPISIQPSSLLGAEVEQEVARLSAPHLLAWTRARGRWELFALMDIEWGPLSTLAGRTNTSNGSWRGAAFGFVDEDSYPALWRRWNARVEAAADAYPMAGDDAERRVIAAFERAVMQHLAGPTSGGGDYRVSQENYDRAVVALRAREREERRRAAQADAARADAAVADAAQREPSPAQREPSRAQREPSADFVDVVRQTAQTRELRSRHIKGLLFWQELRAAARTGNARHPSLQTVLDALNERLDMPGSNGSGWADRMSDWARSRGLTPLSDGGALRARMRAQVIEAIDATFVQSARAPSWPPPALQPIPGRFAEGWVWRGLFGWNDKTINDWTRAVVTWQQWLGLDYADTPAGRAAQFELRVFEQMAQDVPASDSGYAGLRAYIAAVDVVMQTTGQ